MRLCRNALIAIAVLAWWLTGASFIHSVTKDSTMTPVFKAPAIWHYAAAIKGETYHAKGCPYLPPQKPSEANLIYFLSKEEAERQKRLPCDHCIQNISASVPSTPQTTPSVSIAHGNH